MGKISNRVIDTLSTTVVLVTREYTVSTQAGESNSDRSMLKLHGDKLKKLVFPIKRDMNRS